MQVAVADDSGLFRAGLTAILTDLGVEVVVQARTGEELIIALRAATVDVAILDIRMPPTFTDEGLVAAAMLRDRREPVAVLLLSTYVDTLHAKVLLAHDARGVGYLLKDTVDDPQSLLDALHRLVHGEVVLAPSLVERLLGQQRKTNSLGRLTAQERNVLQLVAEGHSNDGISRLLWVTPKTVETHIGRIFAKLDLGPASAHNRRVLATLQWLTRND